jgi:Co/Zn/Cd efflux system component
MISIFIILISILFTNFYKEFNYKNLNNIFFSIERIELVSSLGIIVFLIISNLYMLIEGLHKIIEKDEEVNIPINLFRFICIFKIILNLCSVIYFNKYIIHPFYCKSMQINYWDNHKENMNVLCINLLGEILYCSLFLIYFYNFNAKYFGIYYIIIGFIYLIFNIMCIKPIFVSTTDIFMESKGNYFDKENNLKNQLSELFNEDDVKINSLKMRLNSQNNVVCYLKIKSKLNIDRNQIREDIQKFILEKYLHTINLVIQIDNIL